MLTVAASQNEFTKFVCLRGLLVTVVKLKSLKSTVERHERLTIRGGMRDCMIEGGSKTTGWCREVGERFKLVIGRKRKTNFIAGVK